MSQVAILPYTLEELKSLLINASPWVKVPFVEHSVVLAPESIQDLDLSSEIPEFNGSYEIEFGFWADTTDATKKVSLTAAYETLNVTSEKYLGGTYRRIIDGTSRILRFGSTAASRDTISMCVYLYAYKKLA